MVLRRTTTGQIAETTETFSDRLARLNLDTPTSPQAAVGLGATPKQVDMMGTKAQKKPILEQRVAKEQTLAGVERVGVERREATTAEEQASERAQQISQLGSLGTRVQDLITTQFEQVAQSQLGQAQVSTSLLGQSLGLSVEEAELSKQDPNSTYSQLTDILRQFRDSSDPAAGEQALAALGNLKDPNTGMSYIDPLTAKSLIDTTAAASGKTVAAQMIDQVTIGDIGDERIQEMGFTSMQDLADTLGVSVEDLREMTVPQLDHTVEQLRRDEFSRVATIKAQLKAAPLGSIERERLSQELKGLGQIGVTGIEFDVKEAAEDIDLAEDVKIGGNIWATEDLLSDEGMSELISDWVASDPDERNDIIPSEDYPELTEWLENNQTALAELSLSLGETTKSFETAQIGWKNLGLSEDHNITINDDILSVLLPNWDKTRAVTSAELQTMKADFGASTIGQIMGNFQIADEAGNMVDALSPDEQKSLLTKISGLQDPAMIKMLFGEDSTLSPQQLVEASRTADAVNEDNMLQGLLNKKFGTNFGGRDTFILDADKQAQIKEYGEAVKILRTNGKTDWIAGTGIGYKEFQELDADQMIEMSSADNADERFDNWTKYQQTFKDIEAAEKSQSIDDVLDIAFEGSGIDADQLQDQYNELKKWADMGEPNAKKMTSYFEDNLGFKDGRIDDSDFSLFMDRVKGLQGTVGESDFISDTNNVDTLFGSMKQLLNDSKESRGTFRPDSNYKKFSSWGILAPGKNTIHEAEFDTLINDPLRNEIELAMWLDNNPHINSPWGAGKSGITWIHNKYRAEIQTNVIDIAMMEGNSAYANKNLMYESRNKLIAKSTSQVIREGGVYSSQGFNDAIHKLNNTLASIQGSTQKATIQRERINRELASLNQAKSLATRVEDYRNHGVPSHEVTTAEFRNKGGISDVIADFTRLARENKIPQRYRHVLNREGLVDRNMIRDVTGGGNPALADVLRRYAGDQGRRYKI